MHADVHQRVAARLLEIADARGTNDIGDLVRIADGCGHAMRGDTPVEFIGRDQRAFDVEMGIDKPRNEDQTRHVPDFGRVIAAAGAGDHTIANGNISIH